VPGAFAAHYQEVRMAAITASIEINVPPETVFDYLSQLEKHDEWQTSIKSIEVLTPGETRVGSRAREVREAGGRDQTITYEMTELDPPRVAAFKGVDGPLRPFGRVELTPLDGGGRTRYDFEFDFETHGVAGKMLGGWARKAAQKEIPEDLARLKAKLEN
jgi:uncharacterized protein YndB with AHSA1/START domain